MDVCDTPVITNAVAAVDPSAPTDGGAPPPPASASRLCVGVPFENGRWPRKSTCGEVLSTCTGLTVTDVCDTPVITKAVASVDPSAPTDGGAPPPPESDSRLCVGVPFENDCWPGRPNCREVLPKNTGGSNRCRGCQLVYRRYRLRRNKMRKRKLEETVGRVKQPPAAVATIDKTTQTDFVLVRRPIDSVTDTLRSLTATRQQSFLKFCKDADFKKKSNMQHDESYGPHNDDRYVNIDIGKSSVLHGLHPLMLDVVRRSCPIFLQPFVEVGTSSAHRIFINRIVGGLHEHRDGFRDNLGYFKPTLSVIVHVATAHDPNPVCVRIPVLNGTVKVKAGQSYVIAGHYLQHETRYTPTDGVERFSVVCFQKMKQRVNGVNLSDVLEQYYQ